MGAVTETAVSPVTGIPYPTPASPKHPKIRLVPDPRRDAATQVFDLDSDYDSFLYLGVVLAQCGLPYRDPGHLCGIYTRNNGSVALSLNRGSLLNPFTEQFEMQGYPYGIRPRMLLLHFCTEATRRKSPEIYLGDTFNEFMRLGLGIQPTGGDRGTIGPMKDQLKRLVAAHMRFYFRSGEHRMTMVNPSPFFEKFDFWFPTTIHEAGRWDGMGTVHSEIYKRLDNGCMPLDRHAVLRLLKLQSPMIVDIYTWLAYRNGAWKRKELRSNTISRHALQIQFGPEYSRERDFWRDFQNALKAVKVEYPAAKFDLSGDGLVLHKSPPPVTKTKIIVP